MDKSQEEQQYMFRDDGLIVQSLVQKEKKFEVIREFMEMFELYDQNEQTDISFKMNQMYLKLLAAMKIRDYQEQLKDSYHKQ